MPPPSSSTTASALEYVRQKDAESRRLEETIRSSSASVPASRWETVCANLADILLTHPTFAKERNCHQRLWETCFYQRINELRTRVRKERNANARKQVSATLATVVREALVFYEHLIENLTQRIAGESVDNDSTSSSIVTTGDNDNAEGLAQVVAVAWSLYLNVGDLHRYIAAYPDALKAYETAARMGPGHGHAYNQLAVTHFQQDDAKALVSLYYYIRGGNTQHSPFATQGNVKLTLEKNRKRYIQQVKNNNNNTSTATADGPRPARVESPHFLCALAEYCRTILFPATPAPDMISVDPEQLWKDLRVLLRHMALGDLLLCRIVVILSTLSTAHEVLPNPLGVALLDRILETWDTVSYAGIASATTTTTNAPKALSVRLVAPALLIADWLLLRQEEESDDDESANANAASEFWPRFFRVANLVGQNYPATLAEDNTIRDDDEDDEVGNHPNTVKDPTVRQIKEYQTLRGFVPFRFLPIDTDNDGYLSVEQAAEAVGGSSNGTNNSKNQTKKKEDVHMAKFVRVIALARKLVRQGWGQERKGKFVWGDVVEKDDEDEVMEEEEGDDMQIMDDETEDINTQSLPEPAAAATTMPLLTPADILGAGANPTIAPPPLPVAVAAAATPVVGQPVAPPPGMGSSFLMGNNNSSNVVAGNAPSPQPPVAPNGVYPGVVPGIHLPMMAAPPPPPPPVNHQPPPPGFGLLGQPPQLSYPKQPPPGLGMVNQQMLQQPQQYPMATANPFAANPILAAPQPPPQPQQQHTGSPHLGDLLESSLINSLFEGHETETDNPFAR